MKRILSILMYCLLATGFMFSQGLDWGDFEDGTTIWGNGWGGTATVIDNPETDGNPSSRVLLYEPTAGWQGISHWFNMGVLDSTHKSIVLDVWADSATNIQLTMLNSVDSAAEVFIRDTVIANQWNHIVFDISNIPAYDYQNIAFQNSEVVTFYFDNIRVLTDETSPFDSGWTKLDIKNIVFGTVDNDSDFMAHAYLKWDEDSLHMVFHVVDDSIVSEGTSYQVDNIEVYVDVDNSKRVHWPRNGGWQANDTTFDDNDYQFRLVPGKLWTDFAENRISNAKFEYTRDSAVGYTFHLSLLWDSLMPADTTLADSLAFQATQGTRIGFDVLISDNDATVNDANRNQITWSAPTVYPYNDPSIWGTLELDSIGTFIVIEDTTAPSAPANVMATATLSTVNVSWDASTDDIAVHQYVILQDDEAIDTIFALQTANEFEVEDLEDGTYVFSVIALDVYGNASEAGAADAVDVSGGTNIANTSASGIKVYPNPAASYISISNLEAEASVKIFNTAGQLVLKQTVSDQQQISISSLNNGIYNVQIIEKNKVSVVKFIKK